MRARVVSAVAAALLAACGGGQTTPTPVTAGEPSFDPATRAVAGDRLPDRSLPVLGGSGEISMAELAGTPAVINFWATWCAFCIDEMPDLERAHRALDDRVRFLGVDREDVADDAVALADETGVTYELLEDPDGSFFRALEARGMPTTVLVDADGIIRHRHTGPVTTEQLLALIAEHLGVEA